MKWFGDIAITKEFHFEQVIRGSDTIWFLGVQEQSTCFFLPLDQVQRLAKKFNLKQISMINRKLENRLVILTYDGFSCIHSLELKADYRGPKIPSGGIEREFNLGKENPKKAKFF